MTTPAQHVHADLAGRPALLQDACTRALAYLAALADRPVAPAADAVARLGRLDFALPAAGLDPGTAGTQAAAPPTPGFVTSFRHLFARPGHERLETGARLLLTLAGSATTVAGAVLLLVRSPAGTYVLAAGGLVSLILGLVTAWILLVEVRG